MQLKKAPPSLPGIWVLPHLVAIFIIGFIVYTPTLHYPFIWDDETLVTNNPYIKNWAYVPKFFESDIGAGAGGMYNAYRPLQMVTYALDWSLWKLHVTGYHLSNILLHIFAAFCIYWLILLLFRNKALAFLTGLFFVVHPLHTEAVTYISGRSDSLAAIFLLLTMILYIKDTLNPNTGVRFAMCVSYIAALLARENALILPLLILLYHHTFQKKLSTKKFAPLLIITGFYCLLRFTVLKSLLLHTVVNTSIYQRIPGFFAALFTYVKLLILPFGLHMEYGIKLFRITDAPVLGGIVVFIMLMAGIILTKDRDRTVSFALSWFLLTLIPVSNIYPINAYMAEHWLYIPSIGFFILAAYGWHALQNSPALKGLAVAGIICAIIFYSYATLHQNIYWRDPILFYERMIKFAPESHVIHNNLGNAYHAAGRSDEAIQEYKKAIEINPGYAKAYSNLGFVYASLGKTELAIETYKKALSIDQKDAVLYNNLGNAYYGLGSIQEAIDCYRKAVDVNPYYAKAWYNLGNTYAIAGKNEEALSFLKKAVEFDPTFTDAYNNLGMVYRNMGREEDAIAQFKKAIAIDHLYVRGYKNLAEIYEKRGDTEKAEAILHELDTYHKR